MRYSLVEGKVEVFFPRNDDTDDARRLAKYLAREMTGVTELVSFKLAKRGTIVEIHMVTHKEMLDDPAFVKGLEEDRSDMAKNVFSGSDVELHLCDNEFNVIRVLKP